MADTSLLDINGSQSQLELVKHCESLFEKCKQQRLPFEREWYLNLAFYFGKQYVTWTSAQTGPVARLVDPPAPPWRVRLITNKVRKYVRKEMAKLLQEHPIGYVMPASTDDDDLMASRAAEQINEHLFRVTNQEEEMEKAVFWLSLCGNGFLKDWYDDTVDTDGVRGKICLEAVSPWHLWVPDVQEPDIEKQSCIIHGMAKDPDWVESVFNQRVPPDVSANGALLEQKFLNAIGVPQSNKSHVFVKEIYIKPNGKFPNGIKVIWTGEDNALSISEEWEYQHGEYSFTKLNHIPTGRFYSQSTIPDLIPLQKEYNRGRSQIIESKNRMSKPQLVAQKGAIQANKITSEPGLIIEYIPGFDAPKALELQNLPSYVFEDLYQIVKDMDDIASQHEISEGRTPPNVEAATAIAFLQEEDDSVLSWTIKSIERGTEKIGRHFLSHVSQFWDQERTVRVTGEDEEFEAFLFSGADIKSNTDFKVQAGSAAPRSRAAKQAFIMELGKMEWLPPEKILKYLEMSETGRLYKELQRDERHAQRENLKLSKGEDLPVNSYDNDEIHVMVHDDYRKRQVYERLDDEVKAIYDMHVETHKVKIAMRYGIMLDPGDPMLDMVVYGGPEAIQMVQQMQLAQAQQQQSEQEKVIQTEQQDRQLDIQETAASQSNNGNQ